MACSAGSPYQTRVLAAWQVATARAAAWVSSLGGGDLRGEASAAVGTRMAADEADFGNEPSANEPSAHTWCKRHGVTPLR